MGEDVVIVRDILSVQLTEEDSRIFGRECVYASKRDEYFAGFLMGLSLKQDRRDADIFLSQMQLRTVLKPAGNYIRAMDLDWWDVS